MKKVLLLLTIILAANHPTEASTPPEGIDSMLFAYYEWCTSNTTDPVILLKADTLFQLSAKKKDIRMQCVARQFKADYYYFTGNLDSLKAWIPRVQKFARQHGQLKYYYFSWSRLILYYTKRSQFTLAQYELERYLTQAQADDFKPATADAFIQLAHIYRAKKSYRIAVNYYHKAIDFIEKNDLDKFSLPNHYTALSATYFLSKQYDKALAAIEQGKKSITLPSQTWSLTINEIIVYANTNRISKAKTLLQEVKKSGKQFVPETSLLEAELITYKNSHEYDKALTLVNTLIKLCKSQYDSEYYYFYHYNSLAKIQAAQRDFEAAYKNQEKYLDLYTQKVSEENESSLQEFATLLDVHRLDQEKTQLEQQVLAEWLRFTQFLIWGLAVILLLASIFIFVQVRTNRKLKRAMFAAEESNRMKSIFIRSVTHEINTPLNAIVGFSELAESHSEDDKERTTYIDIIRHNSAQLQKLVNNVLYISDLEAMNTTPALALTDINKCCLECIGKTSELCPETISIRFEPACEQFTTLTSQSLLTKTINELLSNAIQFTASGEIVVTCTPDERARQFVITVTDTGTGILPENAERIFERFYKSDSFSSGLGLGLTVCQMIAHALGGTLRIDTNHTPGARFVLTLPIR